MTQEMGESLVYSWLRHVKGCQIVQTNWKPSPTWKNQNTDLNSFNNINDWFKDVDGLKNENFNINLDTTEKILKTTECDVLGIQFKNKKKIFAVEVAYHENGLDYGGTKCNTIEKVLSKCLRIYICVKSIFPNTPAEIYFVTPKVKGNISKTNKNSFFYTLQNCFKQLNEKIKDKYISFYLIANNEEDGKFTEEDFNNFVIKPLLFASKDVADTSELFLRSIKLLDVVNLSIPKKDLINKDFLKQYDPPANLVRTFVIPILNGMKKNNLNNLLNEKSLPDHDIPLLTNKIIEKNRNRYWSQPIFNKWKKNYYLSNDWSKNNKSKVIDWIVDNIKYM